MEGQPLLPPREGGGRGRKRLLFSTLLVLSAVALIVGTVLVSTSEEEPVSLLWILSSIPDAVQAHVAAINAIPTVPDMPLIADPSEAPQGVQQFWGERENIMKGFQDFLKQKSGAVGVDDQDAAAKAIADVSSKSASSGEATSNVNAHLAYFDHEKELNEDIVDANDVETKAAAAHAAAAANAAKLAAWAIRITNLKPDVESKLAVKKTKDAAADTAKAASDTAAASLAAKISTLETLKNAVTTATSDLATATALVTTREQEYQTAVTTTQTVDQELITAETTSPRDESKIASLSSAFNAAVAAQDAAKTASEAAVSQKASATTTLETAQKSYDTELASSPTQAELEATATSTLTAYQTAKSAADVADSEYQTVFDQLTSFETKEANLKKDIVRIENEAIAAVVASSSSVPV